METIRIDVKGKIARGDGQKIVCDNGSYQVEFAFSEEWDKYPIKTLCVKHNGGKYEEPFSGNIVQLPKILNSVGVEIGVYAADMEVSTPAFFDCVKSIKSGNEVHVDPPKDIYDELITLANETRSIAQSVQDDAAGGVFDGKDGVNGKDGKDGQDGYTPVRGTDYFTETDKSEMVAKVKESVNPFTEVDIDIPTATGVEPYYLALNDSNGLTVTQDTEKALDMYTEIAVGTAVEGIYLYILINSERMYLNLITNAEPGYILETTPVTVYQFLDGIVCHRIGDDAYAIFIYDGEVGFNPTEPSHYHKHSCDFISKDTNEIVSSPELDTPYRFGILYGHAEADIKLKGDTRETGKYALDISNTANNEPVIVSGVANPECDTDAANKGFVVKAIANVNAGGGTGTGVQGPQGVPGENGQDGKSAYEYAVEGGYTGTEAEFAAKMAKNFITLTQAEHDALEAPDPNTYYFIKGDSNVSE